MTSPTPNLPADTGRCVRCGCLALGHEHWGDRKCRWCDHCKHYLTIAQAALELWREIDEWAEGASE